MVEIANVERNQTRETCGCGGEMFKLEATDAQDEVVFEEKKCSVCGVSISAVDTDALEDSKTLVEQVQPP